MNNNFNIAAKLLNIKRIGDDWKVCKFWEEAATGDVP